MVIIALKMQLVQMAEIQKTTSKSEFMRTEIKLSYETIVSVQRTRPTVRLREREIDSVRYPDS